VAIAFATAAVAGGCGSKATGKPATPSASAATSTTTGPVTSLTSPTTASPTKTTSASSKPTATTKPAGGASAARTVPNDIPKRQQVNLISCSQAPGGWSAGGNATNPAKSPTTYDITIFFITPGDTVEGSGTTSVTAPKGGSVTWKVTGKFAAVTGTRCVLRGVA
jgi:hypothetical protein